MVKINTIFTKNDQIAVRDASRLVQTGHTVGMTLPLYLRLPLSGWWKFPLEPLISVSGGNIIKTRNVAKSDRRGTIKERWTEDDLHINIQGTFVNDDMGAFPEDEVIALYEEAVREPKAIEVQNEFLQMLDVCQIVIERFSLPFTKGENTQNFSIDARSDDLYELFIDTKGDV